MAREARSLATADRTVSIGDATESLLSAGAMHNAAHNAQRVISVVVIGVVALIGTLIMGEVYDSIDFDGAAFEDTDGPLEDLPDDLLDGFGAAIGFVPIVLIVLLAALVIRVVSTMG